MKTVLLAALAALAITLNAHAAEPVPVAPVGLKLAPIFSDHMVLQREMPVPIWGTAKPGEKITVSFRDQKASAVAGTNGLWRVQLAAMPAVKEPQELVVAGSTTTTIKDVLVGEVWLGSGQSNLDTPIHFYRDLVPKARELAKTGTIRYYGIPGYVFPEHKEKDRVIPRPPDQTWVPVDPDTAVYCSALQFYFAKRLQDELHVPIGLVNRAIGGTALAGWLPPGSLANDPACAADLERYRQWSKLPAERHLRGTNNSIPDLPAEPVMDWATMKSAKMGEHYASRIEPILSYAVRGMCWDQGEYGTGVPVTPETGLTCLIRAWRSAWGVTPEGFPVLVVQKPQGMSYRPSLNFADRHKGVILQAITTTAAASGKPELKKFACELAQSHLDVPRDWYVTIMVADALSKLGADAASALPALRRIDTKGNPDFARQMQEQIQKIEAALKATGKPAVPAKPAVTKSVVETVDPAVLTAISKANGLAELEPYLRGGRRRYRYAAAKRLGLERGQPGARFLGYAFRPLPAGEIEYLLAQGEFDILRAVVREMAKPAASPIPDLQLNLPRLDFGPFSYGINPMADRFPCYRGEGWRYWEIGQRSPNTHICNSMDLGDDGHPEDKDAYGLRLAELALARIYKRETPHRSPRLEKAEVAGDRIVVRLADVGTGLASRDGGPLRGFRIAGADQIFYDAEATFAGTDRVAVRSQQVPQPVVVTYALPYLGPREARDHGNLISGDGLLAFPFRTTPWQLPADASVLLPKLKGDPETAAGAARCLWQLGQNNDAVFATVARLVLAADANVALVKDLLPLAVSLATAGDVPANQVVDLLLGMATDGQRAKELRYAALLALGQCGTKAASALNRLRAIPTESDKTLNTYVQGAIKEIEPKPAAPAKK